MKRWFLKVVVFAFLMALLHAGTLQSAFLESFHALSPFLFLANCVTGVAALGIAALVCGSLIVALSCWKRRFFCRWVCPLGFLQDLLRALRSSFLRLLRSRIHPTETSVASRKSGFTAGVRFFQVTGGLLALMTLAALVWGGLTFLWMDPLVLLDGAHRMRWSQYLLVGIGVSVLLFPHFWCFFLCPCGGLQELLWRGTHLFRKRQLIPEAESPARPQRRRFLRAVAFLTLGVTGTIWLRKSLKSVSEKTSAFFVRFRPPGAVREPEFLARCTRCGACIHVCPTHFLTPVEDLSCPQTFGTPTLQIVPETSEERLFCDENCTACAEVCPTGAIRKLKQEEKKNVRMAKCQFNYELCRRYYQMECSICLQTCPFGAIEEVWSEEAYAKIPAVNPLLCTGCGKCAAFCPGEPLIRWDADSSGIPGVTEGQGDSNSGNSGSGDFVETTGKKALSLQPLEEIPAKDA